MLKYKNTKVTVDGIKFDSKLEANFYIYLKSLGLQLKLQERFELQPKFKIHNKTYRPIEYVADFSFVWKGNSIIIDAKGLETPVFKLKHKLLMYRYPKLNFYPVKSVKQLKLLLETL